MSEQGTRERLLDAAIELFGDRGFAETSVQAVTSAARANLAAVNYHFGSKEGLLRAVIHRVIGPVNQEQLQRLDALEAGPEPPPTAQIIEAFVLPFFRHLKRDEPDGRAAARLMAHVLTTANTEVRAIPLSEVAPTASRFLRALSRSRPELSPGEVARRFQSMLGTLIVHQLGIGDTVPFFPPASEDEVRAWILTFVTAGFLAPPASDPGTSTH